jgi:hypothetical protein
MNGLDEKCLAGAKKCLAPTAIFTLFYQQPFFEGNGRSKEVFGAILLLRRAKRRMPEPGGLPRHGTHSSWSRHMSG